MGRINFELGELIERTVEGRLSSILSILTLDVVAETMRIWRIFLRMPGLVAFCFDCLA